MALPQHKETPLAINTYVARVCFVCLGNICRSPTAEGVLKAMVGQQKRKGNIIVDSAGTSAYHVGEGADHRAKKAAQRRGIELHSQSRQFLTSDFLRFDYVIAMDRKNQKELLKLCTNKNERSRVYLFRDFIEGGPKASDTPDPYYGGERGFDDILDICEAACAGIIRAIHLRFSDSSHA